MPVASDESYSSIRRDNPLTQADWDDRVFKCPGSSIFHSKGWAAILAGTYGFKPCYFTGTRGKELVSLLPVMEVNSWLTGRRGVSLPFTDHCEPLAASESALRTVIKEALQHGRRVGWKYVELRGLPAVAAGFPGAQPSVTFFIHQLKLFPDTEFLFSRLESSVRRAIRKGQKSGLTIESSTDEAAMRTYYALHCVTRKEHGLPPQPLAFFLNIQKHLLSQNQGMVVTARREGRAVASAVYLHRGSAAMYKFGASDAEGQELRANNLVMWEAIQRFAREGKAVLDFGRTSISNEGLRRYKLGWGTLETRAHYHRYDLRSDTFVQAGDDALGWHNRVFRAMPAPLSRWAGSVLYRHMA